MNKKPLQGIRILVAEDEDLLREIFVEEFSSCGAMVESAVNGNEAIALFDKEHYHLVISDIKMHGGDGLLLMKHISESNRPQPKLFLCSGFSDYTNEEAEKFGVIEVFHKPFKWDYLYNAILKSLGIDTAAA